MNILDSPFELTSGQTDTLNKIKSLIDNFDIRGLSVKYTIQGYAGTGKLQPYDSKIITPSGIKLMGDIKKDDYVIAKNGKSTKVIEVFPKKDLEIYKVTFEDNTSVECCIDHLWQVQTNKQRQTGKYDVLSTRALIRNGLLDTQSFKYSVDLCEPVEHTKKELPIDPYTLGYILGNGYSHQHGVTITTHYEDCDEICNYIVADIASIKISPHYAETVGKINISVKIVEKLKQLQLYEVKSNDKFIPNDYLYSCIEDRIAILQGLMDSDGSIQLFEFKKKVRFSTSSEKLAKNVVQLIQSLGGIANINISDRTHQNKGIEYSVILRTRQNCFKLNRKKEKFDAVDYKFKFRKKITSIDYVGIKDGQCLLVDNKEHLYLTDSYTVTHNTTIVPNIIKYARHTNRFNNVYVLAPTNKAKLVLSTKLDRVKGMYDISTLHSLLYGEPDDEDGENKWILNTNIKNSLLLIDESSMIDLKLYEDIVEACESCLIVFLGDIFQLEQIGKQSPVFTDLPKSELKEVKRQDNSILMLATYIRNNNANVYTETDDIKVLSKGEALTSIVTDLQNPETEDTVFIVATNKTRNNLNSAIRQRLGHTDKLNIGDKLISISNSDKLVNGEIFSVNEFEYIDTVPLYVYDKYKPIECDVDLYKINGQYSMLVNIEAASLTHPQINKGVSSLFNLFGEHFRHYLQEKRRTSAFDDIEYRNKLSKSVIICTYGYAISCHKSQGSQFKSVYIHQDFNARTWNGAKWFYTAITRAVEKVYVVPNHEYQRKIVL